MEQKDFTGVFTYSPIGPVEPTGEHLEWGGLYGEDGNVGSTTRTRSRPT